MVRALARLLLFHAAIMVPVVGCRGEQDAAQLERGGQAYLAQCAVCHGAGGAGDGPLAALIVSDGARPPAALDARRVGALGPAGVRRAIETGAHLRAGSSMPVWGPHLGPEWTERITAYVTAMPSMGNRGRGAVDRYLAAPPGTPPPGRRAYVTYCSSCHGPQGAGDGFFSAELAEQLKPAPLGGARLSTLDDDALTRLIEAGGGHAPEAVTMPGWLHRIQPDERRALVGYLRSLP
jgi:mono/diheme cytochrome c family protein